tara:strand:+ start:26 stop:448 length:423 start_codon:yes stop_codon:yes gene_type:complete
MALKSCSSASKLCLALFLLPLLSSCSGFKKILPVEIKTVEIERQIPVQNRPRPISLGNIHFYVVTEDTFPAFKKRFVKENGDLLFYALSVRDYETLALNMAGIKRFLAQQKHIILYYEKAVAPKAKKEMTDKLREEKRGS